MMKIFSILSILCCLAVPCSAQIVCGTHGGILGGATGCSFSSSDADVFAESFEGSTDGYDNTWTETVGGGTSSIDPDASHTGTFSCLDKCSHALKIICDGTNAAKTVASVTSSSTLYSKAHLYVDAEGLADSGYTFIFGAWNDTDLTWYIELIQESGALKLSLSYYNGSGMSAYASTASISIQAWYSVSVTWVSGGTGHFYLDGAEQGAGWTGGSRSINKLQLGTGIPSATYTIYFDNLKADNDTMPAECSE
jgi:hypothetical protein